MKGNKDLLITFSMCVLTLTLRSAVFVLNNLEKISRKNTFVY